MLRELSDAWQSIQFFLLPMYSYKAYLSYLVNAHKMFTLQLTTPSLFTALLLNPTSLFANLLIPAAYSYLPRFVCTLRIKSISVFDHQNRNLYFFFHLLFFLLNPVIKHGMSSVIVGATKILVESLACEKNGQRILFRMISSV